MKKPTKILLLISIIVSFVALAGYLVAGIIMVFLGSNPQAILEVMLSDGMTGITLETVKNTICATYLSSGIVLLVAAVFCIPTGILSIVCRKKLVAGTTKAEMKAKAILLIVFGALSFEFPIIPAVFMLAMNEEAYK